jgi:hypothetical protein
MTAKGRDILTNRIKGSGTEPLNIAWGNNPATLTAATTDVALFKPATEARTAGTSTQQTTTTSNDTYQVVGTITSTGTQTIAEVGLFDNSTAPYTSTVTGGTAVGSNSGTTLTVAASYTPANGTYIQIRTEVLQVTAGTGTTSLTVARGQNGSTAISTIANTDEVTAGNIPGSSTITGGSMFLHADHGANSLNNGDTITYTVKISYT